MCLIAFAADVGAYWLVLAANRDEAHARSTLAAHAWKDAPVLGGRDLAAGGTWLAFGRSGRLAAVTNVRRGVPEAGARSRGLLCSEFAGGSVDAASYAREVAAAREHYAGFNLLVCDRRSIEYASRDAAGAVTVSPGIHGLSNAALDVPWPKVRRATETLRGALDGPEHELVPALFALLADRRGAPDAELPATGVPLDLERRLAPIFIASPGYGTRSSTVVLWRRDGRVTFEERSFDASGASSGVVREAFDAI